MKEIDISLIQGALRPGDVLSGVISIDGPGEPLVHVTLQGEEVLSANSMAFHYVLPFFEAATTVDCSKGPGEFRLTLPESLPPTYFSQDLRCLYVLKARRKGAASFLGFARDAIHRLDIPVLPAPCHPELQQHWFVLKGGGVELEVRLDNIQVEPGQNLTGELLIRRPQQGPLPKELSFRFAAIEESIKNGYSHRKVMSLQTRDIVPEEDLDYPVQGYFEFPVPLSAPESGTWNTFKVHYGFRVGMTLADGSQVRESLPILVSRYPAELDG